MARGFFQTTNFELNPGNGPVYFSAIKIFRINVFTFFSRKESKQRNCSQQIFLTPFIALVRRKIKLALASLGLKQNFAFPSLAYKRLKI